MSNEHESSGSGILLPAMALGGAGLGMYGLHRAGVFGRHGLTSAASAADPAVAAAMKNSMKPTGTVAAAGANSSVADSMAASMRRNPGLTAANTQAGAADAQRSLGLTMDPAVEASMAGTVAPAAAPTVENLGGLNVNTADLGRPGAAGRKPRGKAAPAQAVPAPAPAPTSPLIGSNMITRMHTPPAAATPGLAHGGMLAGLPRR